VKVLNSGFDTGVVATFIIDIFWYLQQVFKSFVRNPPFPSVLHDTAEASAAYK
jgi:hypothetical protein